MICQYCFQTKASAKPHCNEYTIVPSQQGLIGVDGRGGGCNYGLKHSYDEEKEAPPTKQEKKIDKQLCLNCGLHPKNPKFKDSKCEHMFADNAPEWFSKIKISENKNQLTAED